MHPSILEASTALVCLSIVITAVSLDIMARAMKLRRAAQALYTHPPQPTHVHILDLNRSEINITDAGGVHARCCIAGCAEAIYIGPNLARSLIGESAEVL